MKRKAETPPSTPAGAADAEKTSPPTNGPEFAPVDRFRRPETDQKHEQLLAVAARLMAAKGYADTSIRDVAREAPCSLGGVYYYVRGKDELLFQIQQRTFLALLDEQRGAIAGIAAPDEKLRQIVRTYLAFFIRHTNELKVCAYELESLHGEKFDEIREIRREWYRIVAEIVGEIVGRPHKPGREDRHVRHRTLFIFGMLNWIFMWFDSARDEPIDKLAADMLDMIFNGLHRADP